MASSCSFHSIITLPINSPECCRNHTSPIYPSQFLSSNSILKLKKRTFLPTIQTKKLHKQHSPTKPVVYAVQSNIFKVLQTAWNVGKDAIEAGTSLVPESIPRPVARTSVTVVAGAIALFVLKSILSTAFFVLAMMGVIYFTFIAFNKDERPPRIDERSPIEDNGSTPSIEDSLEEARRIMEKYK